MRGWAGLFYPLSLAAIAVVGLLVLAPERHIATRIHIAAPPARVWAVLVDTAAYRDWAPGMRLAGDLAPGHVITHVEGEGSDRMVFHPVVLTADPGRALRWFGGIWFPRLLDATHAFLLRQDGGGTLVVQEEDFRGVGLWFFDPAQLVPHFDTVNDALRLRAEQR